LICLDTNVVIAVVSGRLPIVRVRLREQWRAGVEIQLPAVVLFEMRYGAAKGERRAVSEAAVDEFLASGIAIAPFDAEDAAHAGDIRADLEAKGTPIGPYDTLIAAQARRRGATLVTANMREFARVPGLLVADWAV
jgi:tRNA(fMet)-specific endonuclease VapC